MSAESLMLGYRAGEAKAPLKNDGDGGGGLWRAAVECSVGVAVWRMPERVGERGAEEAGEGKGIE